MRVPELAAKDNGRLWLAQTARRRRSAKPTPRVTARNVRSLGAASLYGQRASGFAATLGPRALERDSIDSSLRSLLRRVHARASASVQVFIAADGLPLRTRLTLHVGAATLRIDNDILAIDFPRTVVAPPVGETIAAATRSARTRQRLRLTAGARASVAGASEKVSSRAPHFSYGRSG